MRASVPLVAVVELVLESLIVAPAGTVALSGALIALESVLILIPRFLIVVQIPDP